VCRASIWPSPTLPQPWLRSLTTLNDDDDDDDDNNNNSYLQK